MGSHYDSKKSKEAARDIGDKIFKLQPFDALGVFVLCLLLSFVCFIVGGMSLMLIDYIFGIFNLKYWEFFHWSKFILKKTILYIPVKIKSLIYQRGQKTK